MKFYQACGESGTPLTADRVSIGTVILEHCLAIFANPKYAWIDLTDINYSEQKIKSRLKGTYYCFRSYELQDWAKLIVCDKFRTAVSLEEVWSGKEPKGTLWGDGNILYIGAVQVGMHLSKFLLELHT